MARQYDLPCSSNSSVMVCLQESDIEGATLHEPFEAKTVLQLRTCHGVQPLSKSCIDHKVFLNRDKGAVLLSHVLYLG